jgi:nucleoside-diphosphate-sugar epimerase
MKILIVGGSSALAQVLQPALSLFAKVLTAGRSGCNVPLDLSWPDEQFHLPEGIDTVIQLASHFGGKDFDGMLAAEQVNVLGTLKLCHACTRAGVRHLLLVSSIFAGLGEDSPFYGSYALSKRHAEEVTRLYCASFNLPLTILRPAQIYGVGESFRKHQPFLYSIIDKAENNEEIVFYGANDAQRNLIHAEDVAEIIARVTQQRIEGIYTCPSPVNVRYSEIAAAAIAAFGSSSTIRFAPDKPTISDNAFAPDDRLYHRIGFFPRITLALGVKKEAARRKGRI